MNNVLLSVLAAVSLRKSEEKKVALRTDVNTGGPEALPVSVFCLIYFHFTCIIKSL